MTDLRKLLWLYLLLLIFEGALRKWIIPALDTPLLLIRDPLVIWIYFQAARQGLRFNNVFSVANLLLAIITAGLALMFGQAGSLLPLVTIYGLRTDFLQIPLIFLMPQILDRDDVLAMGKFLLYVAILMVPLVVLQFRSPQDSWWNKGTMPTPYGTVRTSGTFSFGVGLNSFYALSSVFLLYGYINTRTYKMWLITLVTFATLLNAAVSGSRSGLVEIGIVVGVAILCVVTRGKGGMGLLIGGAIIAIAVSVLSSTSVVQQGTDQLNQRFEDAGREEKGAAGFVTRYVNSVVGPLAEMDRVPFLGYGLGLGTNAGLGMYNGKDPLFWPEPEWERLIFECGPIFGLLLCIFRTALTAYIGMCAFEAYRRDNILPALIFATSGILLFNGQWGVPNTLGFAIFTGGLGLAACNEPEEWQHEDGEDDPDLEHDTEHEDADGESEPPHPADRIG